MYNTFSKPEIERYSRQIVLPEIGYEGQSKLKSAKVLIVGMGGLGSPAGLYLAAAGVGTIGVVDFDAVTASNLHRQVLYSIFDVGKSKAKSAAEKLRSLNPEIQIQEHNLRLSSKNISGIFNNYEIVLDGSDNFATRYLVNDACVLLGKSNVYGSILGFQGQVSVYVPGTTPCYRCLYPEPPEAGTVPTCEEAGVLGVLPGIIGSIQASEVIKLIIGKGKLLTGTLLTADALSLNFRKYEFARNAACPVCGNNPVITNLADYENFCNPKKYENSNNQNFKNNMNGNSHSITPAELKKKMDRNENIFLLDVREPFEKEISDIGGVLIPMGDIAGSVNQLNKEDEIVVYCRSGARSDSAAKWLRSIGFNAKNLTGGINAWSEEVDSSVPKY